MPRFDRQELQQLRERAEQMAGVKGTSSSWVRAYLAIADAVDALDAMIARTEVHGMPVGLDGTYPAVGTDSLEDIHKKIRNELDKQSQKNWKVGGVNAMPEV